MSEDPNTIKQRREKFIKEVCKSEVVWLLENTDGFATTSSNEYDNEDGEPVDLICFWSDLDLAKDCVSGDWKGYNPAEVTLGDFIENWCVGMHEDGLMIGTNLDPEMIGSESDPLEMIIALGKELKTLNKELELKAYENVGDLVNEAERILKDDETALLP
jgi:hypothetical protein